MGAIVHETYDSKILSFNSVSYIYFLDGNFTFVYHKLDENNLNNTKEIYHYSPLLQSPLSQHESMLTYTSDLRNKLSTEYLPTFSSYGKCVLIYARSDNPLTPNGATRSAMFC